MHVAQRGGAPAPRRSPCSSSVQGELGFLPWRMGEACHLGRESAEDLEVHSRSLRNLLQATIPAGDTRPAADSLRAALLAQGARPGSG